FEVLFSPHGSIHGRLARGTFWTLLGTLVAQGASLVSSIIAARLLGPAGYGELGMVRSTMLLLSIPAGTGLGIVASKYVAQYRDVDPARAGRLIGLLLALATFLSVLVMLLCLATTGPLANAALKAGQLEMPLR